MPIIELPDILQSLQNKQWTGTLEVILEREGRRGYLFLRQGTVQHCRLDRSQLVLGQALYEQGEIDEADYVLTLVDYEQTGRRFGEVLVELGLVSAEAIRQGLVVQAREDLLHTLTWKDVDVRFHQGEPPLPSVFGARELEAALQMQPMSLLMEAARRADEWDLVREHIPSEDDVLVAPDPTALQRAGLDRRVMLLVDGYRSAYEIAEQAPLPRLDCLRALAELVRDGVLARLSPEELIQVGLIAEGDQELEKALKVYELASARGFEHLDLDRRLARVLLQLGRREQSLERWVALAERCQREERRDLAIGALQDALELDPGAISLRRRLVTLLSEEGEQGEAVEESRELLVQARKKELGPAEMRELLEQHLELDAGDEVALRELAELLAAGGDAVAAMVRMDELATLLLEHQDLKGAVAVYYRALEIDPENLQARLQLAKTLADAGSADDAVREYRRLADTLYRSGVIDNQINWPFLIRVYESIVALEPSSTAAWEWLAKAYLEDGQTDLAVSRYLGMAQSLRPEAGQAPPLELLQPLRRVVELDPTRLDVRQELAEAHLGLQQLERGARVLRELAEEAIRQGKVEEAQRAYERALAAQPFDADSRRGLAVIHERAGRRELAQVIWRDTGVMVLKAGLAAQAVQDLQRALALRPDDAEAQRERAAALARSGRTKEAAQALIGYASQMLATANYGLAREATEAAQRLAPQAPELGELRARLAAAQP